MNLHFVGKVVPRWMLAVFIAIPCCFVAVLAIAIACFILGVCILAYNCTLASILIDDSKVRTMMFNIWHSKYTTSDIKDSFFCLTRQCFGFPKVR